MRYLSTNWLVIEIVIIVFFRADGQLRAEVCLHRQPAPIRFGGFVDRAQCVPHSYGSTKCREFHSHRGMQLALP